MMVTHELDNFYLQYAKQEEVFSKGEHFFITYSNSLLNIINRYLNEQIYLTQITKNIVPYVENKDLLKIIDNRD